VDFALRDTIEDRVEPSSPPDEEGTPERSEGGDVLQLNIFIFEELLVSDLPGRASRRPSPPRQEGNIQTFFSCGSKAQIDST
jgi:hypothetical protein